VTTPSDPLLSYPDALTRLLSVTSSPRLGLARMERLLAMLDDPQRDFTALHVAGTNGKGSVCVMLDAMLRANGYRVGLTTSPHLTSARERVVIDGAPIGEADFVRHESRIARAAARMGDDPPTFFERMIAMAFLAFSEARVDVAVVEVGLGGRLDATSTCVARACAVVSISRDHTEWLGDTIAQIAREKAGIARARVPLVIGPLVSEAHDAVVAVAHAAGAPVVRVSREADADVRFVVENGSLCVTRGDRTLLPATQIALHGAHQEVNAAVAMALLDVAGLPARVEKTRDALAHVVHPGRYETLSTDPLLIVDGAHNEDGARALVRALADDARVRDRPIHIVVGATRGHDPAAFAATLASAGLRPATVIATRARAPRSLAAEQVATGYVSTYVDKVRVVEGVANAVDDACARARESAGVVVVMGSLYLVGEARLRTVDAPCDDVLPLF
jgi:dihydrofolate synthase/folylpolyglutamate synthase